MLRSFARIKVARKEKILSRRYREKRDVRKKTRTRGHPFEQLITFFMHNYLIDFDAKDIIDNYLKYFDVENRPQHSTKKF